MDTPTNAVRSKSGSNLRIINRAAHPRAYGVPPASTALVAGALPRVDWSDAYAVDSPGGAPPRDPQEWADEIFHSPTPAVRVLFGVREALIRIVGIEPGGKDVFAMVSRAPGEVLIGTDQRHLSFRASVLVERERVVLSTVVQLHNRRGRAYSALVRRVHPWVVRTMLAGAARRLTVSS